MTLVGNGRSQTFRFVLPDLQGKIDLYGDDGVQYGIHAWDERFQLQLANPGEARPQDFNRADNKRSQFYDFERDR